MTKRDLTDGKRPDHQAVPEEVSEENWFFLLSKESGWLKKLLTQKGGYQIVPASRSQETMALIERGLEDVSFSRPTSSLKWGIPVPGDPEQTMYVWCDALTNYISGIDIFGLSDGPFDSAPLRSGSFDSAHGSGRSTKGATTMSEAPRGRVEWWDKAEVTHVIGKDIARFHALIWPAMLKHAGVRTPDRLLIHGFLTCDGQKMSKSIGNVVEPEKVLDRFNGNPDPLRFYLSHEIPVGNDGDFSWERIEKLYDSVLRNKVGNLLNRVLVLLNKAGGGLHLPKGGNIEGKKNDEGELQLGYYGPYEKFMNDFDLSRALQHALLQVEGLNLSIDLEKPWSMENDAKTAYVSGVAERLRHIALMLLPFIPQAAQEISHQLGVPYAEQMLEKSFKITKEMKEWGGQKNWKAVGEPEILFKPLSE